MGTTEYYDVASRVRQYFHGTVAAPDTVRADSLDQAGELLQYGDSTYLSSGACALGEMGETCTPAGSGAAIRWATFVYDSVGNRKDSPTQAYSAAPGNRLTHWGQFRMDYDADGNLVRKRRYRSVTDTSQVLETDSLFWSALSQLDSAKIFDSTGALTRRTTYGYDGWGRRVRRTPGATQRYLWDGSDLKVKLD